MSAASHLERQRRSVLVRYLQPSLIEQMLGVPPEQIGAWASGDRTVPHNHACGAAYFCFEYTARTLGLQDAHQWFTAGNASLGGAAPAQVITHLKAETLAAARSDSPFPTTPLIAQDRDGRLRVALAGDWHGNLPHAIGSIERLARSGVRTILHLGDFGLWPGEAGAKYIRRVTQACDEHDLTILVTDGNHEDHARLALIEPFDGVRWISDRIGFHVRGHRWQWAETTFASLGGAPSVNRDDLVDGVSWWPAEQITHLDLAKTIAGGPVDVLLTHDAPEPSTKAVDDVLRHNPQGWPREALEYAEVGRTRLSLAFLTLQPRLLVHGHHHVVDRATVRVPAGTRDSHVVSLGCDGMGGNLAILDIDTLDVAIH